MKILIHSRKLERAIKIAKDIVCPNRDIQITTNKLDVVRMAINREYDAVMLHFSINEQSNDFVIDAIKSIDPDYPIILYGKDLPGNKYLMEECIYYMDSPPDSVKLKEILNQIKLNAVKRKP